jgi:two-component system, chemotaxis family, CheB/CheR fusion protein
LHQTLGTKNQEEATGTLAEVEGTTREAIQNTRSLSVDLSPPILHDEGLVEAISWLAVQMERQHGLAVTVQAGNALPLPHADLRVLLFQIVRELLFNIVKHAGIPTAQVTLGYVNEQIRIEVRDTGNGFTGNIPNAKNSQGLARIQQRLQLIGGNMQLETAPREGTCVTIYSPLHSEMSDSRPLPLDSGSSKLSF